MMSHEQLQALRESVNAELKRPALGGLTPDRGERIISGLSSGSLLLNMALSGSPLIGFVRGRIVEFFGPEQSAKTTLALHTICEAQKFEQETGEPTPCLFIDAEYALDTYYAQNLGVDLSRLTISQPGCAEEALNEVEVAVRKGFKLIVVDSVSALTPRAEIEGEMGESHVGLQARLMGQAMRKLTSVISKSNALVIFINQIRMKIGVMFGNPETTSGGNALKFYATYRLDIRSPRSGKKTGKTLMGYGVEDQAEFGSVVNVKVIKNKVFPPHRAASFVVEYGKGIDKRADIIAFLEFAGAFSAAKSEKGKVKGDVVFIQSKDKWYTSSGLSKILDDPAVHADAMAIVKKLGEGQL